MENTSTETETVIRGVVRRITFRNSENGYTVLKLGVHDQQEEITVVGHCLAFGVGAHVAIRGTYTTHPRFGRQYTAGGAEEIPPETEAGIEKYLGSGFIKGIGPKTAERLVQHFGRETLEVIHRDPERLASVPGVGRHKALLIQEAFANRQDRLEIERFFTEHNVTLGLTEKVYKQYGARAIEVIKRDPYVLAHHMRGVGFATADSIALNIGLEPTSPQRLKAGLYYALEKACEEGHCYLDWQQLVQKAALLLRIAPEHDFDPLLESLVAEQLAVRDGDRIYARSLYEAEKFVSTFVAARCHPLERALVSEHGVGGCIAAAEEAFGFKFSFEQREAVQLAVRYPLLMITGGPGCGKTTIIRALAHTFERAGKTLALAAPTGKAAQKMSQVCDLPASTIHRLLKYDPLTGGFKYGINCPLRRGDDGERLVEAVIIDEASMIDIMLARDLCSAIPLDAPLILVVGDKDQLPSVGPGRVFADLLAVREIKTISLSRLFRRSDTSHITTIAHTVNAGIPPDIPEPDGVTKSDAYFVIKRDPEEAARTVETLVHSQIPAKFGIDHNDIVVLTPSNRGPLGTIALNQRLQERMNPVQAEEQVLKIGDHEFRIADRVCQRVNNYRIDALGVFNGDTGSVYSINREDRSLVVELWDGRLIKYDKSVLHQLSLSYALSVHRAQGSEMPCVVLALHESHFTLLEKQLLYTGITRAKQLLIIVGSRKGLAIASKRATTRRRLAFLQDRIVARLEGTVP